MRTVLLLDSQVKTKELSSKVSSASTSSNESWPRTRTSFEAVGPFTRMFIIDVKLEGRIEMPRTFPTSKLSLPPWSLFVVRPAGSWGDDHWSIAFSVRMTGFKPVSARAKILEMFLFNLIAVKVTSIWWRQRIARSLLDLASAWKSYSICKAGGCQRKMLGQYSVWEMSKDCQLFLWGCDMKLFEAIRVGESWDALLKVPRWNSWPAGTSGRWEGYRSQMPDILEDNE